ncbi:HD-GYP domain-containing protein [Methylophaga sp.]|uniref:HD-GYP domain-containing protein n=1 Tax=Methylophaga sp. TaxID=2024840 RepID=UPI003F6976D8
MKTHTTLGYEAIVRAEHALGVELDFLKHAKDIALSHQEKWHGSGYPAGLSGQQIPLAARLMAQADVYVALISRRVCKPPSSHEKAVEIITEGRGKHFDPVLVDIFLQIHESFRQIAAQHADPDK